MTNGFRVRVTSHGARHTDKLASALADGAPRAGGGTTSTSSLQRRRPGFKFTVTVGRRHCDWHALGAGGTGTSLQLGSNSRHCDAGRAAAPAAPDRD